VFPFGKWSIPVWLILAILVTIQLVPVDRSAPVDAGVVQAPERVVQILKQNCFDCHSNHTRWPWYGYLAPVSWWVNHHIEEARDALNLTTWNDYDADEQAEFVEEMWDEVDLGKMPPNYYLWMHPNAALNQNEKQALAAWSASVTD
jgi:hypothetical protein